MLQISVLPFTSLETPRLLLRRVEKTDAPALFAMRSNTEVMKYIGRPMAKTMEDALELIGKYDESLEKNEGITWAVTLKGQPEMLGTLGFWRIEKENYRAEIGYTLSPTYQGKGIMHEAIGVALEYAFTTLKLHSICANIDPRNQPSATILERNNFVKEAHFKENFFFNGEFLDTAIYTLLASNYKKAKPKVV